MRSDYKFEIISRAKALIEENTDDSLVYAALELRQCIEAIVYEKLKGYKKYVPGVVFSKWQPHHALKTLLYFEPDAEESAILRVAPESSPGVRSGPFETIGFHRALSVAWLSKNYNKLGSYLHVQREKSTHSKTKELSEYLSQVHTKLTEIAKNTIISIAIAERIEFKCVACKKNTLANAQSVDKSGQAICIHPECAALHTITRENDHWKIKLVGARFVCSNCKTENSVPLTDIHIGMTCKCVECHEEHVIVDQSWRIQTMKEYQKTTTNTQQTTS